MNQTLSSQSETADLEIIRQRLLHLWCAVGIDAADASPAVRAAVERMDENAGATLEKQRWEPGHPCHGSTNGCSTPITPEQAGLWPYFYLGGPTALAIAWSCPLSRYFRDPHLIERLEASLRYIEPVLRPDTPRHGSWYLWDIANPEYLAQTLILCGDQLSDSLRAAMNECLLGIPNKVFEVERGRGVTKPANQGGANMMHVLFGLMLRGVALGDEQWVADAAAQLPVAMSVGGDGQGVQEDWSFHFHGRGVNLGYGLTSLVLQAQWIYLTHGTPWACQEEQLEQHIGIIREFYRFNVWKGRISPYATDRGIASLRGIYADGFLLTANYGILSGFESEVRQMLVGFARQSLTEPENAPTGEPLGQILLREAAAPIVAAEAETFSGMRFYPTSDYLLAQRRDWFVAARMGSTRTKTWNAQNGQHLHGSAGVEFSVALMTDGREFDHTTIPTMDWGRLMGVTRCDAIETPPEGYGQSAFVGGLADDDFAVLGMDYLLAPPGQDTLRANKSLFVTPDALVLLGNRIRCDAELPVVTTLFQAPLVEGAEYRCKGEALDVAGDGSWNFEAGDWLLLRNVAVRLLFPATLHIRTREGTYNAMNDPHNAKSDAWAKVHCHRWIYLMAEHGVGPRDGSYGAILWPAVAADFQPPRETPVVRQEANLHRVEVPALQCGGEVRFPTDFRQPGGLSYYGAEPFKWGSIARWTPTGDPERFDLEILPPQRYLREPNGASTEIFLPDGFEAENVTLVTMEGKPFPPNLLSLQANGQTRNLRVRRTSKLAAS